MVKSIIHNNCTSYKIKPCYMLCQLISIYIYNYDSLTLPCIVSGKKKLTVNVPKFYSTLSVVWGYAWHPRCTGRVTLLNIHRQIQSEEFRLLGCGALYILMNRRFGRKHRLNLQGDQVAAVCTHVLTLVPRSRIFLPWRWRRYISPKRRFTQDIHNATSQKTEFFSHRRENLKSY